MKKELDLSPDAEFEYVGHDDDEVLKFMVDSSQYGDDDTNCLGFLIRRSSGRIDTEWTDRFGNFSDVPCIRNKTKKIAFYINVYTDGEHTTFETSAEADLDNAKVVAHHGTEECRIACLYVEGEKGQFDE